MQLIGLAPLIGVALATSASAQVPPAGPQPTMVRRMAAPSPPPAFLGDEATVPMSLDHGLPAVEVTIGGKTYRFGIDTGATGHGRIRAAAAEALGLAVTGEVRAGDGSGRSQLRKSYRADSLKLGNITFRDVALSEMMAPPGRLDELDGVLGLQFFGNHLLSLDFPGKSVSLSRGSLPASAIGYQLERGMITVPLSIGGSTIPAHIDVGNAVAPLILPAAFAEKLPKAGEARQAGTARTAVSTIQMWEADIVLPVKIGELVLPISRIGYPALGETGNLGSRAFEGAILRIDQRNRRIEISFVSGERG